VEHRLPQEELVCPECGGEMTIIGKEALVVRPAEAFLRRDIYYRATGTVPIAPQVWAKRIWITKALLIVGGLL
jgi:hypothetical protein